MNKDWGICEKDFSDYRFVGGYMKNKILLIVLVVLLIILGTLTLAPGQKENPKDYMLVSRGNFTATLLKDNTVLITGGDRLDKLEVLKSAEIYNPKTHKSTYTGSLNQRRARHKAILLDDGKVLIVGGNGLRDAELYNPKTGKFELTGKITTVPKSNFLNLVKLNDGRIFVFNDGLIDIYNPKTGKFKLVGKSPYNHNINTVALLPDENIIIMGISSEKIKKDTYEPRTSIIFNPKTNQFIKGPQMFRERRGPKSITLNDGRILVLGGDTLYSEPVQNIDIYDPKMNKFSYAGVTAKPRVEYNPVLLPNGKIYIVSGDYLHHNDLTNNSTKYKSTCEVYNPQKQLSSLTNICTKKLKYCYVPILLPDNNLLIIGGGNPRMTDFEKREIEIINTKEIK